jgi:hypothetical protein
MTTKREQILAAVNTLLAPTAGVSGRVYRSRQEAFSRSESKSVVIEPGPSTSSRILGRVPVVAGNVSTTGMFDMTSELVLDGQAVSIENALTVTTAELGHLRFSDAISVNGINYTVRQEPMRIGDGMLCVVSLESVS